MMGTSQDFRPVQSPKDIDLLHSEVEIKGLSSDVEPQDTRDRDEAQLARLGKKQVLKVRDHRLILVKITLLTFTA